MKILKRHLAAGGLAAVFVFGGAFDLTPRSFAKDQTRVLYGNVLEPAKAGHSAPGGSSEVAMRSTPVEGAARVAFWLERAVPPALGPPGPEAGHRPPAPLGLQLPPPPGGVRTFAGPPFPSISLDRLGCDESIDHRAAMAGYLKSKLRLQAGQRDAWQKIEQAAEPATDKMREICASLPPEPGPPPSSPNMVGIAEKQLAAQAELLRAIAGPLQALYDVLSPEQRAVLDRPPRF
jgi:hypothetical protein